MAERVRERSLYDAIGALARVLGRRGILQVDSIFRCICRRRRRRKRVRRGVPEGRCWRWRSVRGGDELKTERDVFGEGRCLGECEVIDASLEAERIRRRVRRDGVDRGRVGRREYRVTSGR